MMAKQDLGLLGAFDSEIHYCYYAILYNIGVEDEEHAVLGSAKDCKACVLESSYFSNFVTFHTLLMCMFSRSGRMTNIGTSL